MGSAWNTNNLMGGTQQNLATTFKTLVAVFVTTGALRRIILVSYRFGTTDVPNATDCPCIADLSKMTADGTGTAVTPRPRADGLETGTQAPALTTSKANYTAEPTVTAASSHDTWAGNQRSSVFWGALDDDDKIVVPAVAAAGLVLRARSPTYASTGLGQLGFRE